MRPVRSKKVTPETMPPQVANATPVAEVRLDTTDRPNSLDSLKFRGMTLEQRPMTIKAHASVRVARKLDRDTRFHQLCIAAAKTKTVTIVGNFTADDTGKVLTSVTPEVWVSRDEWETLRKSGSVTLTGIQLTAAEVERLATPLLNDREEMNEISERRPDESAKELGLLNDEGKATCGAKTSCCMGTFKPLRRFIVTRNVNTGKREVKLDRSNNRVEVGSFRAVDGKIEGICPGCYGHFKGLIEQERAKGVRVSDLRTFPASDVAGFIKRTSEREQADKAALGRFSPVANEWGEGFRRANSGGRRNSR